MKPNQYYFLLLVLVLMAVGTSSCYYDETILVEESTDVGELSFQADIIPIFNQSCNTAGCHNGTVPPDLRADKAYNSLVNGSYVNIASPEDSELYQWMKGNRSAPMPLTGPNSAYNAKVLAWIKQGALNN